MLVYNSSELTLIDVDAGDDWTGNWFSSSGTKYNGFLHFGGVLTTTLNGMIEVAVLTFQPKYTLTATVLKAASYILLNSDGATIPSMPSPAANITVLFNYTYIPDIPDLDITLSNLDPVQTLCTNTLPCNCSSPEQGDLNGDCIFDIRDVLYFYQSDSLYTGTCLEKSHDFNIDGRCTEQDILYLLRVNFHQLYFVNDLSIVPVNSEVCFLDIRATLSSRGIIDTTGDQDYLLIGLFHRDSDFQAKADDTTPYLQIGHHVEFTSSHPPTTNGDFFRAVYNNNTGVYRLLLETPIDKEDTGLVLLQAHRDAFNEIPSSLMGIILGSGNIPEIYPEYLESTVQIVDTWTFKFERDLGFSPLKIFNQSFSSPRCINENRPVFQPRNKTIEVYENVTVGSVITFVFANDSDADANAEILYFLHEPSELINATFRINQTTGEIYLLQTLDRESDDHYQIGLLARDKGVVNTLNGFGTLDIYVLDINDNTPVFDPITYIVTQPIPETTPVNTSIVNVHATDTDAGMNMIITYRLQGVTDVFKINSTSGDIYIVSPLNYETNPSYNLTVEARDGGNPSRSVTINVFIQISPVNEHPPDCYPVNRLAIVAEDEFIGSQFFPVVVSDPDVGSNHSVLSYSISPQTQFGVNKISDMEAVLYTLTDDFNRKVTPNYTVIVTVSDAEGLNCDVTITIVVGEPSRLNFTIQFDGHLMGYSTRVTNGHSQNATFFNFPLPQAIIKAQLGPVSESVTLQQDLLPPAEFNAFLYQSTIWV